MEQVEKLHFSPVDITPDRYTENEPCTSDSEQDLESGTPRSGESDIDTPRSLTSEESSAVTSPRAKLLWDHGFDVASGERKSPDERDGEWRRFNNKTDDDKIIADKCMKMQEIAYKKHELSDRDANKNAKSGLGLPDLIPSLSEHGSVRSSQETLYAVEELDFPPPLPESDPPNLDISDFPPPLPATSPPTLYTSQENTTEKIEDTAKDRNYLHDRYENMVDENVDTDSDDTDELCNENSFWIKNDTDESSSAAGDVSDPDTDTDIDQSVTNFDGFYNVQSHTVFRMDSDSRTPKPHPDVIDDVEAEFDFILKSLNSESESQETYVERFAGRRDKYGFILSPVIEAPSPTPSNMSSYSGYSGISCSSPDPFGVFRMSPGPSKNSKQEIDLSSLCVKSTEWDFGNEQTVPIYQTVHAKKVFAVPEGFGWDSGDDLLSPTGSGEWDSYDNGLSTPPVSTFSVNLSQFGTHITGWKQPEAAIYEEPENYNSDSTIDNDDDSDTDTTLDDDSPRDNHCNLSTVSVTECESPEKNISDMNETAHLPTETKEISEPVEDVKVVDESVQAMELLVLEDGIKEVENELKLLKIHTVRKDDMIENGEQDLFEMKCKLEERKTYCDAQADIVVEENSVDYNYGGFSEEIDQISQMDGNSVKSEKSLTTEDVVSIDSSLDRRCRRRIRVQANHEVSSSDDESDTTEESDEDAEDELSDSDNENDKEENTGSDFGLFKTKSLRHEENDNLYEEQSLHDNVSVTELLSPRSAILLSGGMFPEESDTYTSDETEDQGDATPDENMSSYGSGIKVSQYTSGDSDDNCSGMKNKQIDTLKANDVKVKNQSENKFSLRNQNSSEQNDRIENEETINLTNTLTIQSPLDFSMLDSKFETYSKSELRKSPRIFGRYYSEMDDQTLEEIRSKCESIETPRSEPEEIPDSLLVKTNSDKKSQHDIEEFEKAFKHVDITNSSSINAKVKCTDGYSDDTPCDRIKQTPLNAHVGRDYSTHGKINDETLESACILQVDISDIRKEVIKTVSKDKQENIKTSENPRNPLPGSNLQSPRKEKDQNMHNKENGIHTKTSPKKSSLLKIKIGHLARRGSARSKVKHGYVHELSELFDKDKAELNDITPQKEKKTTNKQRMKIERAQTPKTLTPNEQIVIFDKNTTEFADERVNISTQESLGFEVTPLQKVTTFNDTQCDPIRHIISDEETIRYEQFQYSSDEESTCMSDSGELKRYEEQLRVIEKDQDENIDKINGGITVYEDNSNDNDIGTFEFTPKLDTFSEMNTQEKISLKMLEMDQEDMRKDKSDDEHEEIEENIDGETDSDQSEDEEFHKRYFLPGHFYHINDSKNGEQLGEKINQDVKETTEAGKQDLRKDSDRKTEENVVVDISNETRISTVDNSHAVSQQDLHSYENNVPDVEQTNVPLDQISTSIAGASHRRDNTVKQSNSENSHVDMSNFLWNIPWKTLKERKQENMSAKSTKGSRERTRMKQSGYLYDIISRINMERTPNVAKTELQANVIKENDAVEEKNETNDPPVYMSIRSKHCPTAVSETGEFDFLAESANDVSKEPKTKLRETILPDRLQGHEYSEDPQFKIRYPSSLSRRLYGPYCRLRLKETNGNEREKNPPVLKQNSDSNLNSTSVGDLSNVCQLNTKSNYISCFQEENVVENNEKWLHNENLFRPTAEFSRVTISPQSPVSFKENSITDSPTDNLSIHSDGHNSNPNNFSYTSYDVKTPLSSITQRDGIKNNLKAINGSERNQAQQKPLVCEDNFDIVNLLHGRNEAKTDKQKCDSSKISFYGENNCDVKFIKLPMHIECKRVDSKYRNEISREINNDNLGVDTNTTVVKNDDDHTSLGVHILTELSANGPKQQNVDMNNEFVSTSHKVSTVKTNKAGINRISASVTTQNINLHPMSSGDAVTEVKSVSNGDTKTPEADEKHTSRASFVLQTPGFKHVLEDERGKLRIWPYSDFGDSDKLPVTLHRVRKGIKNLGKKGMSSSSNSMTVIQSAERSAEMPENRVVQKYHSSSILPANRTTGQIMKAHGESVQSVLLQDANGNNVSEEEMASVLPKIAESISKMDNSNAEEILPGITQSITKLKNGGNLVITTMTRKLDEDESSSSGRGSPEPDYPVLNVDDLENSKIYLVQDSKGELFYVEDVTSETQESAYFSSRNTSESVSDTGNSPTFERISKINSVGESGINESTAQEILSAMYGNGGVNEMTENEEEWSERTYEYNLPRRKDSGEQKQYSKDSFKTSYMVEEPGDSLPRLKSATAKDRYESSYQMAGGSPWVYDGGMAQSYSQVTQGVFADEANSIDAVSTQNLDNSGVKTIERYTIEGEAIDYPAPVPTFVPPMVVQTDVPQYSLVKVDVTPKHKDEGVMAQIEAPKPVETIERPIYKTVAHIQTPEKLPSPKPVEKKKYKIIASKATEQQEEQETHMRFDEIDYKFSAENVEYTMKPATAETQYFVKNTTKIQPQSQFKSEKRIELGQSSDQKYKSQIQVQEPKKEVYEHSKYSYDQMKSELEQTESNMRVVRGSYLIKNTLDDADTALDDNINMFDRDFTLCKDNPLYHSDEDLYRRLERERIENARRQEKLQRELNQDITFETVDRFSKSKAGECFVYKFA